MVDRALNPGEGSKRRSFRVEFTALVGFLILVGSAWWFWSRGRDNRALVPTTPTVAQGSEGKPDARALIEQFVGDKACLECHPGESASHSRSGHSRTLGPVAKRTLTQWLDGKTFNDPELVGVTWSFVFKNGKLDLHRSEGTTKLTLPIDQIFGSGRHGASFVSLKVPTDRIGEHLDIEHRLSYFADGKRLGITPGQGGEKPTEGSTPIGRIIQSREVKACFLCHTTLLSSTDPDILNTATMVAGVGCERCHGPGSQHVRAARQGETKLDMPFGPETTAAEQLQLCGQCHRHPDFTELSKIKPGNREIVRFQPVGLMQSKCYLSTPGGISCSTCHDPHARSSTDISMYESKCLSCHGSVESKPSICGLTPSPRNGCIGCHMPKQEAIGGLTFHDHWIRPPGKDAGGHRVGTDHPTPRRDIADGFMK